VVAVAPAAGVAEKVCPLKQNPAARRMA